MEINNGNLFLFGKPITSLPDNLTVGGGLVLRGTQITSLPDYLTVGGSLDLSGTPITSLPENLTVGRWLDLSKTSITGLPDNLKVGRGIFPYRIQDSCKKNYKKLKNGDYVPNRYLYADGILTHVKGRKEIKSYVYYQGKIKNKNVIFDGKNYAHCRTFKEGVADLNFKAAEERGAEQYKKLNLNSELNPEEMIAMYRIITGACKQGTELFVRSLGTLKEKYSVREAIEITKGQYNSDIFKNFFENTQHIFGL